MRVPDTRVSPSVRRLVLVGSFLVVAIATTAVFAQAMTGHLAAMHAPSADVTVADYEVTDDGALDVTLRVHNPTMKEFELVYTRIRANVDGELVTVGTRFMLDGVVQSGETKTASVRLEFQDGGEETFRTADPERLEFEGTIRVRIVEELIFVPVDGMEESA